ncbi:hypothetical protein M501DRAFT_309201 [Patellaria atrata CBS 101060]|uniref:Uncharacterized protein n=1 Tax=Patellaria atrata CBS 101060 TaxID=1346257 RepID=A0A9P4S459_9PEZI|nr:hypothetical protein M501DRAFT_309201 [Patellaria atrata CBS 101060]
MKFQVPHFTFASISSVASLSLRSLQHQIPLLRHKHIQEPEQPVVTVAFDIGHNEIIHVRMPLHKKISFESLPHVPNAPKRASIFPVDPQLGVEGEHDEKARIDRLEKIVCTVYPIISPSERWIKGEAGILMDGNEQYSMWFMLNDGWVDFREPHMRWFLAGRELDSIECV